MVPESIMLASEGGERGTPAGHENPKTALVAYRFEGTHSSLLGVKTLPTIGSGAWYRKLS